MFKLKIDINKEPELDFWLGIVYGIYLATFLWMVMPPEPAPQVAIAAGTSTSTFTCSSEQPEVRPRGISQ